MDWTRLALDYIDTLVWPLVVVFLVAFSLLRFRENIGGLIDRIQRGTGPAGLGFDAPLPPPEQGPTAPTGGAEGAVLADMAARYSNAIATLAKTETDISQLTANFNAVSTFYQFEKIYRLIHGTQLNLMRNLRSQPDRTASTEEMGKFFTEHLRITSIIVGYTADRETYFNFLTNFKVIELLDGGKYRLSDWGGWFLDYMEQEGLSRYKRY